MIHKRLEELERLQNEMLLLHTLEQYSEEYGEYLLQKNTELSKQEEYQLADGQLEKFRKHLNREYKKSQPHRRSRWAGRIAVAIAILMVIMLIMVCSVGAFRQATIKILASMDNTYGSIHPYGITVGENEIDITKYIPEEYGEPTFQKVGDTVTLHYANNTGNEICFIQQKIDSGGVIDIEDTTSETIVMNNISLTLYTKANGEKYHYNFVWGNDTYMFVLQGDKKEPLVNIIQQL